MRWGSLLAVGLAALVAVGVAIAQGVGEGYREVGRLVEGLREPSAVVFLDEQRIAVADTAANSVSLFEPTGKRLWVADDLGFHQPSGLCFDPRGVWVADAGNHRMVLLDGRNGSVLETISLGAGIYPTDLALGSAGIIWVSASPNNMLLRVNSEKRSLRVLETVGGKPLRAPRGLVADQEGGVWVVEALGGPVRHVDANGDLIGTVGSWGVGGGQFAKPKDVALLADGGMAVLDTQLGVVHLLDADGGFLRLVAGPDSLYRFTHALGIAASADRLAVADAGSGHVLLLEAGARAFDGGRYPEPEVLVGHVSIHDMDPSVVCRQCHDGTRRLNPGIWDRETFNHPLEHSSELSLPEDLRLTEQGDLDCFSCHAMHRPDGETEDDTGPVELEEGEPESILVACEHCHQALLDGALEQPRQSHAVGKTLPWSADREALASLTTIVDDRVECRTCHRPHGALSDKLLVVPADSSSALCQGCHKREVNNASGHPFDEEPSEDMAAVLADNGVVLTTDGRLDCLSCHAPHDNASAPLLRFPGGPLGACEVCHQDRFEQIQRGDHHEKSCVDCHGMHRENQPTSEMCAECHEDQTEEAGRGGHGDAVCMDCHRVHEQDPMSVWVGADDNPFSLRCLSCHAVDADWGDVPRVAFYQHPVELFTPEGDAWTSLAEIPLFDQAGEPLQLGAAGEVTCGTCHRTHGPDPQRKRPQLRRPQWKLACPICHGPDALLFYQYFHYPDNR